jgi:ketosteroid isomerase-like protein
MSSNNDVHKADVFSRFEIHELIDRYHAAINLQDWSLLGELFAQDAVWEARAPFNMRFEGREAIVKGLIASVARQEMLVQSSSGIAIEVHSSDFANIRSTLIEFGREANSGRGWSAVAFYFDRVRRDGGVWRFAERSLQLRYEDDAPIGSNIIPLTQK